MKCSVPFAILLEITANLYVHRRRHRRQPTGGAGIDRQQGIDRRQGIDSRKEAQIGCAGNTERNQAVLAAYGHKGRQAQADKDVDGQGAPSR
jgi:hypothetical protein